MAKLLGKVASELVLKKQQHAQFLALPQLCGQLARQFIAVENDRFDLLELTHCSREAPGQPKLAKAQGFETLAALLEESRRKLPTRRVHLKDLERAKLRREGAVFCGSG